MRVAVVSEETDRHGSSDAALRIGEVADLLAGRGHDVAVFCARWWESGREFGVDDLTYHAVVPDLGAPDRRLITRLPEAVRSFDPDVIHASAANPAAVHASRLAAALTRTPLVADWYDVERSRGMRERARRLAARIPDVVVTPSRLVETGVRELGRAPEGLAVVPNPIDMDRVRSVEPEPLADVVYSRPLDDDAYLESLLLALAELRETDWRAAVIGDGPARADYERQAADLRIDDRVRFLGDRPLDRRLAVFKGAHVAVHTALRAPFATDFLWALACGCVGIAEYHVGSSAHELIEGRDRGVRVTSEEELAAALRDAADRPRRELDETYAAFDRSRVLERYLECYRRAGALP